MSVKDELTELQGMLKSMNEHIKFAEDALDAHISLTRFKPEIKDVLRAMTVDDINSINDENLHSYAKKTGVTIAEYTEDFNNLTEGEEPSPATVVDYVKKLLLDFKSEIEAVDDLYSQMNEVDNNIAKATSNYFEYVNSHEYKEKRKNQINELRERALNEEDPIKKKKYMEGVENTEKALSLEFIFDRLNSLGEKEIDNIADIYFDDVRSTLLNQRYMKKITKFSHRQDMHKMFFNLEEKFLPEEYHDFNNLFLFNVMRFIAYSDPYSAKDKLFVSSILLNMYNLLYHKFATEEDEKAFIKLIMDYDDRFRKHFDRFTANNISSPNHPNRKAADANYELKKRTKAIAALREKGVEVDINKSTEELIADFTEILEKEQEDANKPADTVDYTVSDNTEAKDVWEDKTGVEFQVQTFDVMNRNLREYSSENIPKNSYYDKFGCKYVVVADSDLVVYNYYDEKGDIIETDVPERDVLNLINTNNLTTEKPEGEITK